MKKNPMKTANDKLDKRISERDRTLSNADQPRKFKLQGILEILDKTMNQMSKLINVYKEAVMLMVTVEQLVNTRVTSVLSSMK